jgi:hypothetical protein
LENKGAARATSAEVVTGGSATTKELPLLLLLLLLLLLPLVAADESTFARFAAGLESPCGSSF